MVACRLLLNPTIASVFHRLGLVERFDTGIRRIRESYQVYSQYPLFDIREKNITVILPVGDQACVFSLFNRADVQALLRISATSAKRLLSAMVDDKLLVMEGKGPGGHYRRWRL